MLFSGRPTSAAGEQRFRPTLILDEALWVVSTLKVTRSDIHKLPIAYDESTRLVTWKDTEYSGLFGPLKRQVQSGSVHFMDETMLLWVFPKETLEAFPDMIVLTYLFSGSLMKHYLDICGLPYEIKYVRWGMLFNGLGKDIGEKYSFRLHLHIDSSPKRNAIDNDEFALSVSWYKKKKERSIPLRHVYNFLHNVCKASCDQAMYTFFKEVKQLGAIGRYQNKSFVSCNCRATNACGDRKVLAYLINIYVNPYIKRWFEQQSVTVDEEVSALSQMVRWIWRSAIRNGACVKLYLPSARMRRLLMQWLYEGEEEKLQTKIQSEKKSKVRVLRTMRYKPL